MKYFPRGSKKIIKGIVVSLTLVTSVSFAQTWPDKKITLVVPFTPGAVSDSLGRAVAEQMSKSLGQPVVVENRPGAGGRIAAVAIQRAPKDGYTIGLLTPSALATGPILDPSTPYDPFKAFTFLSLAFEGYTIFVTNPAVPAKSLGEFIAYSKSNPGKINYGSLGVGSTVHFNMELFQDLTGLQMTHVPYRGDAEAVQGLIANDVQIYTGTGAMKPMIQSGRIVPLATTGDKPWDFMPELPTAASAAKLPGYKYSLWWGFMAPQGIPPAIEEKLRRAINEAVRSPSIKEIAKQSGTVPVGTTGEEFRETFEKEYAAYLTLAKMRNIKLEK